MDILNKYWLIVLLTVTVSMVEGIPLAQTQDGPGSVNDTQLQNTPIRSWVSEPKGRGSFKILTSCILTLFLCVWTTVHVNIEPGIAKQGKEQDSIIYSKRWHKLISKLDTAFAKQPVRKLGWSFASLLVPEITMTIAAYERNTARHLRKESTLRWWWRHGKENDKRASDSSKSTVSKIPNHPHDCPWNDLALSYYAVMGGFRVVLREQSSEKEIANERELIRRPSQSPISSSFPQIGQGQGMLASILFRENRVAWSSLKPVPSATLTPHGVLLMDELGVLPYVAPEFVRDKSKANTLAKVLVCFQAAWMIIQVVARATLGQQVTLIELHTVLHTVCAVTMYITWWDKPIDILLPTEIPLTKDQFEALCNAEKEQPHRPNPTNPLSSESLSYNGLICDSTGKNSRGENKTRKHNSPPVSGEPDSKYVTSRAGLGILMFQQLCPPSVRSNQKGSIRKYFSFLGEAFERVIDARTNIWREELFLSGVGLAYGGVHLATWNNHFPTAVEGWMWRICSIVTAVAVLGFVSQLYIGGLITFLAMHLGKGTDISTLTQNEANNQKPEIRKSTGRKKHSRFWKFYKGFVAITCGIGIFIVMTARVFLLIESFISLRSLPSEAYESIPWVEAWPHFG